MVHIVNTLASMTKHTDKRFASLKREGLGVRHVGESGESKVRRRKEYDREDKTLEFKGRKDDREFKQLPKAGAPGAKYRSNSLKAAKYAKGSHLPRVYRDYIDDIYDNYVRNHRLGVYPTHRDIESFMKIRYGPKINSYCREYRDEYGHRSTFAPYKLRDASLGGWLNYEHVAYDLKQLYYPMLKDGRGRVIVDDTVLCRLRDYHLRKEKVGPGIVIGGAALTEKAKRRGKVVINGREHVVAPDALVYATPFRPFHVVMQQRQQAAEKLGTTDYRVIEGAVEIRTFVPFLNGNNGSTTNTDDHDFGLSVYYDQVRRVYVFTVMYPNPFRVGEEVVVGGQAGFWVVLSGFGRQYTGHDEQPDLILAPAERVGSIDQMMILIHNFVVNQLNGSHGEYTNSDDVEQASDKARIDEFLVREHSQETFNPSLLRRYHALTREIEKDARNPLMERTRHANLVHLHTIVRAAHCYARNKVPGFDPTEAEVSEAQALNIVFERVREKIRPRKSGASRKRGPAAFARQAEKVAAKPLVINKAAGNGAPTKPAAVPRVDRAPAQVPQLADDPLAAAGGGPVRNENAPRGCNAPPPGPPAPQQAPIPEEVLEIPPEGPRGEGAEPEVVPPQPFFVPLKEVELYVCMTEDAEEGGRWRYGWKAWRLGYLAYRMAMVSAAPVEDAILHFMASGRTLRVQSVIAYLKNNHRRVYTRENIGYVPTQLIDDATYVWQQTMMTISTAENRSIVPTTVRSVTEYIQSLNCSTPVLEVLGSVGSSIATATSSPSITLAATSLVAIAGVTSRYSGVISDYVMSNGITNQEGTVPSLVQHSLTPGLPTPTTPSMPPVPPTGSSTRNLVWSGFKAISRHCTVFGCAAAVVVGTSAYGVYLWTRQPAGVRDAPVHGNLPVPDAPGVQQRQDNVAMVVEEEENGQVWLI